MRNFAESQTLNFWKRHERMKSGPQALSKETLSEKTISVALNTLSLYTSDFFILISHNIYINIYN